MITIHKCIIRNTVKWMLMVLTSFIIPACSHSPKDAQEQTANKSEGKLANRARFDSPYHTDLNTSINGEKCRDLKLVSDGNKTVQLAGLLKDGGPKLIFRFREFDCDLCYKQVLEICNGLDSLYADGLLVVGTFESDREFRLLKATYAPKLRFFNIKTGRPFNNELDGLDRPYFCKVDGNLNISNPYIPNKKYPGHTKEYIEQHFKTK